MPITESFTEMIHHGDCLDILPTLDANSVDAVVTDPPYGLSFMGKDWDHGIPGVEFWKAAYRVMKPGAFLLSFGGTRTFHRLTCAIEDAGLEIRDCMMWLYGSGFPKSHDVSKAIDKAAGAERDEIGPNASYFHKVGQKNTNGGLYDKQSTFNRPAMETAPATPAARQWSGWGTALKPAWEPIIVARKPLEGTVAQNVLKWGTGGMNIDGGRIGTEELSAHGGGQNGDGRKYGGGVGIPAIAAGANPHTGRWPANVILDEEAGAMLDGQSGDLGKITGGSCGKKAAGKLGAFAGLERPVISYPNDRGGASRFFYCAKASKRERNAGCEGLPLIEKSNGNKWTDQDYRVTRGERPPSAQSGPRQNTHPTVKPISLLTYLAKLVCPPGGVILDPFMGSGSMGVAAQNLGFNFIGIEKEKSYCDISSKRMSLLHEFAHACNS